jgi:hypothetical protein
LGPGFFIPDPVSQYHPLLLYSGPGVSIPSPSSLYKTRHLSTKTKKRRKFGLKTNVDPIRLKKKAVIVKYITVPIPDDRIGG